MEIIKEALFRIFIFLVITIFLPILLLILAIDMIILDRDGRCISKFLDKWNTKK